MAISKFRPGETVFKCSSCGIRTRRTSSDTAEDICENCYELAGLENGVADGHGVETYLREAVERYKAITKKGGSYDFWTDLGDAVLAEIAKENA